MRILWVFDLDSESEMRHGANLRVFNLTRQLLLEGHEVYLATNRRAMDDPVKKERFLHHLVDQRFISSHFETTYAPPTAARRWARLGLHPALVDRALARFQEPTRVMVEGFVARCRVDLCVVADRPSLLFLVPSLSQAIPTLIDWIDSFVLFWLRQIALYCGRGRLASIPYAARRLFEAYTQESYYSRRCHANLTASPADARCLSLVSRVPRRNKVLLNGVAIKPSAPDVAPLPNRVIFSGNMSFPPNCEAALWFIDQVMPLLRERRRDILLVVAGANPPEELLAKASPSVHVTGYVADLEHEIARSALCIAPMVSGGGFKNKIVEAIAADRFVVATSRAVEFLDPTLKAYLLVADTPRSMADRILTYLDNPSAYEPALGVLRRRIAADFSWAKRAEELLAVARSIAGARAGDESPAIPSVPGEAPLLTAVTREVPRTGVATGEGIADASQDRTRRP
jgi:glycosyltransferase involved in cell wall biosynthesis